MDIIKTICKELSLKENQVINAIKLIDEGNTIPFIARYRKEATNYLTDNDLRNLYERLIYLRKLNERVETCLRQIEELGKLTDEIKTSFENASAYCIESPIDLDARLYAVVTPNMNPASSTVNFNALSHNPGIIMNRPPTIIIAADRPTIVCMSSICS